MAYSELFDRLPAPISERVYRRLYEALTNNAPARSNSRAGVIDISSKANHQS